MDLENKGHLNIVKSLGFNWMAMDEDRTWVVFKTKPTLQKKQGCWINKGGNDFIETELRPYYVGDWHSSLIDLRKL